MNLNHLCDKQSFVLYIFIHTYIIYIFVYNQTICNKFNNELCISASPSTTTRVISIIMIIIIEAAVSQTDKKQEKLDKSHTVQKELLNGYIYIYL